MQALVILAHPAYNQSLANKTIIEELSNSHANLTIRHLDAIYPSYAIDVKAEQELLMTTSTIILQFPFYWYSCPASLKNWLDQVLTYNFAYGPEGTKLAGKRLILSLTIGGPAQAYHPLGYNHFSVSEFLRPFEQTAYLTQMQYCPPIYSHQMDYVPNLKNVKEQVIERAKQHAWQLLTVIQA
jgi:putative NADPH-quinone reductase